MHFLSKLISFSILYAGILLSHAIYAATTLTYQIENVQKHKNRTISLYLHKQQLKIEGDKLSVLFDKKTLHMRFLFPKKSEFVDVSQNTLKNLRPFIINLKKMGKNANNKLAAKIISSLGLQKDNSDGEKLKLELKMAKSKCPIALNCQEFEGLLSGQVRLGLWIATAKSLNIPSVEIQTLQAFVAHLGNELVPEEFADVFHSLQNGSGIAAEAHLFAKDKTLVTKIELKKLDHRNFKSSFFTVPRSYRLRPIPFFQ